MNREQFLLTKLAEECAEVAQRALKQVQFGKDEIQKDQPLTNAERLKDEIMDLLSLVNLLEDAGEITHITANDVTAAEAKKAKKMNKYLKLSNQLGTIPEGFTV